MATFFKQFHTTDFLDDGGIKIGGGNFELGRLRVLKGFYIVFAKTDLRRDEHSGTPPPNNIVFELVGPSPTTADETRAPIDRSTHIWLDQPLPPPGTGPTGPLQPQKGRTETILLTIPVIPDNFPPDAESQEIIFRCTPGNQGVFRCSNVSLTAIGADPFNPPI